MTSMFRSPTPTLTPSVAEPIDNNVEEDIDEELARLEKEIAALEGENEENTSISDEE